jgi:hypothetical protein
MVFGKVYILVMGHMVVLDCPTILNMFYWFPFQFPISKDTIKNPCQPFEHPVLEISFFLLKKSIPHSA